MPMRMSRGRVSIGCSSVGCGTKRMGGGVGFRDDATAGGRQLEAKLGWGEPQTGTGLFAPLRAALGPRDQASLPPPSKGGGGADCRLLELLAVLCPGDRRDQLAVDVVEAEGTGVLEADDAVLVDHEGLRHA